MDPDTLDLPAFTRHTAGLAVIAQRVRCRLHTHRGDWPLDTSAGIDWIGFLGRKPVDLAGLAAELALEILATPGVTQVQDLEWSQDGGNATITATILTELGTSLALVVDPQDSTGNPSITVGGVLGHSGTIAP
jgi:hypothetical protein